MGNLNYFGHQKDHVEFRVYFNLFWDIHNLRIFKSVLNFDILKSSHGYPKILLNLGYP